MMETKEYIKELVRLSMQDIEDLGKELEEIKNSTEMNEQTKLLETKFCLGQIYTVSKYIYKLQHDLVFSIAELQEVISSYARKDKSNG